MIFAREEVSYGHDLFKKGSHTVEPVVSTHHESIYVEGPLEMNRCHEL